MLFFFVFLYFWPADLRFICVSLWRRRVACRLEKKIGYVYMACVGMASYSVSLEYAVIFARWAQDSLDLGRFTRRVCYFTAVFRSVPYIRRKKKNYYVCKSKARFGSWTRALPGVTLVCLFLHGFLSRYCSVPPRLQYQHTAREPKTHTTRLVVYRLNSTNLCT